MKLCTIYINLFIINYMKFIIENIYNWGAINITEILI